MMAIAGVPWQLECEKMEQRCEYLLTSGQWSDCTFMVGSEADDNETAVAAFQAHKLVLAMASPVFEAMFYGGLSERDPIVQIPDLLPETFKALLRYMYTGETEIESFDMAWDLWYGAKKYMLPHLEEKCRTCINLVLGPNNACRAYEFACFFDEKTLMDKCIKIISTNTKEVLNDNSFVDLQLKTVVTVFSQDELNVSELELFNALVRYAEAAKRQSLTSAAKKLSEKLLSLSAESSSLTSTGAELNSSRPTKAVPPEPIDDEIQITEEEPIRRALREIRFLSLTIEQFSEGPAVSDQLTKDESYAIFVNMTSTASSVKMPTGFSECRGPRIAPKEHCYRAGCLEHITKAVKCGTAVQFQESAITNLIALLARGGEVGRKAAWVLGTIVLDIPKIRDAVLNLGAISAMLPHIHSSTPSVQLQTYVAAYRNMCRCYDQQFVNFELVSPVLPNITELLVNLPNNPEVLTRACGALGHLIYLKPDRTESVQAVPGLTKRLIDLLEHPALQVQIEALRAISNMVAGTDVQVNRCLEAGCLIHIIKFLRSEKSVLLKEIAAMASGNILCKTPSHIKKALETPMLVLLIKLMSEEHDECRFYSAKALRNMCVVGTAEQLDVLVSAGYLEPYCRLLSSPSNLLVLTVLHGLRHLLQLKPMTPTSFEISNQVSRPEPIEDVLKVEKVGRKTRLAVCEKLREIGAAKILTTLQQHDDEEISRAASFFKTYFPEAVLDNTQETPMIEF